MINRNGETRGYTPKHTWYEKELDNIKSPYMNVKRIIIKDKDVNLIYDDKTKTLDIQRVVLGINGNLQVDTAKGVINIKPVDGLLRCESRGGDYWTQVYHCKVKEKW